MITLGIAMFALALIASRRMIQLADEFVREYQRYQSERNYH